VGLLLLYLLVEDKVIIASIVVKYTLLKTELWDVWYTRNAPSEVSRKAQGLVEDLFLSFVSI